MRWVVCSVDSRQVERTISVTNKYPHPSYVAYHSPYIVVTTKHKGKWLAILCNTDVNVHSTLVRYCLLQVDSYFKVVDVPSGEEIWDVHLSSAGLFFLTRKRLIPYRSGLNSALTLNFVAVEGTTPTNRRSSFHSLLCLR